MHVSTVRLRSFVPASHASHDCVSVEHPVGVSSTVNVNKINEIKPVYARTQARVNSDLHAKECEEMRQVGKVNHRLKRGEEGMRK